MAATQADLEVETPKRGIVCVTHATGDFGSYLIMRLLERGYKVRAIVPNPDDTEKTAILQNLPGAEERLQVVKVMLSDENGYDDAVSGCEGVFHCSSPREFDNYTDPQKECIEPAAQSVLKILSSCAKSPSIKRVVHTSSASAIVFTALKPAPGQVFDETCWTDVEMCLREKMYGWPYFLSRTLAEQKAIQISEKNGIDLIDHLTNHGDRAIPVRPDSH